MKIIARLCLATAVSFAAVGCNQPADTHDADVAALKALETQWVQEFAAKDAEKVGAHYADDATLMPPGMAPAAGRAAILAMDKEQLADPAFALKFAATRVEVAKSGDVGFTQGTYTMSLTDPATKQVINDHGTYLTAYRKQADGSWKAVSDMQASSVPPPAPAPVAAPAKKK